MLTMFHSPKRWLSVLALTLAVLVAGAFAFSTGALAKPPEGKGGGNGGGGGGAITNPALVFNGSSRKSKSWDIFVRTADGSGDQQLTKDDVQDFWPAWSPDGKRIAFLRQRASDSPYYDLYLINPDGTGLRLLKDFVADEEPIIPDGFTGFDWSPDGTMIVLDGLYVLDVATAQGSYLLGPPDAWWDGIQPAWSPDGTMIAFTSFVEDPLTGTGTWDLFVVDLATLDVVDLTPNVGRNRLPAWSPDGNMIAFVADRDLAVMTLADGTVDVVVQDPELYVSEWDSRPTWTPDGGSIVFAAVRSLSTQIRDWDLFRVSPTGTGLTNITGTDHRSEGQVDWNPAW
jgi:TolB protein